MYDENLGARKIVYRSGPTEFSVVPWQAESSERIQIRVSVVRAFVTWDLHNGSKESQSRDRLENMSLTYLTVPSFSHETNEHHRFGAQKNAN